MKNPNKPPKKLDSFFLNFFLLANRLNPLLFSILLPFLFGTVILCKQKTNNNRSFPRHPQKEGGLIIY